MSTASQAEIGPAESRPKVPWVSVAVFMVVANALAWVVTLPLWISGGLNNPAAGALIVVMMFTPLIAALLVTFGLQKRPRKLGLSYLGVWPLRPLKRTLWMTAIGVFGSIAIVIAGVFLASALGLVDLDLQSFSGFAALASSLGSQTQPIPLSVLVVVQFLSMPVAALLNGFFAFGEELGWRGWLLPSLRPLGTWPALILSSVVWGLWHSPIILLGYNFDQPNMFGVGIMITGCVFYGVLVGWLRLRSRSIWPSVFAHGAFNAAGGSILLLSVAGTSVNSAALNPLGWATWIVMALVIAVLVASGQFKNLAETEPGVTARSLDRR